jgi:hypothetical protein
LRTVADVADDFRRGGLGQEDVHVALGDLGDAPRPGGTAKPAAGADQSRDRPDRQGWRRRGGNGKR